MTYNDQSDNKVPHEWSKTTVQPLDVEDESQGTRRTMDPELRTIAAILRLLDDMPDRARDRIVSYLSDRYTEIKP